MDININIEELYDLEKKNGRQFDYVKLTVSDLNGVLRTNVVPRRHLEGNLREFSGCPTVLTSSPRTDVVLPVGFEKHFVGNITFIPCKGTLHNCPWVGLRRKKLADKDEWLVGEIYCELKWPLKLGNCMIEANPRFALRKQLDKLKEMDFELMSAFEVEYVLLSKDTLKPVFDGKDCGVSIVHWKFEDYLYTIETYCRKAGLDISALRVEHGEGQFELVMEPEFGIKGADNATTIKQAVKEISNSMGYLATFMSQLRDLSSSGFHLNFSLWRSTPDGKHINAFYDAEDADNMSSLMKHFIAGLMKHAKALMAFCSPTFNCYKRLHNFLTPHKNNWSFDNRLVAFRVKSDDEKSTYIENRLPSSACNPYLTTAATIAAGLDGVINKLPLPDKFDEKIDTSTFSNYINHNDENTFPYSLEEALNELEKDEVLKKSLGDELVSWFIQLKRRSEVDKLKVLNPEELWKKEYELFLEFI